MIEINYFLPVLLKAQFGIQDYSELSNNHHWHGFIFVNQNVDHIDRRDVAGECPKALDFAIITNERMIPPVLLHLRGLI